MSYEEIMDQFTIEHGDDWARKYEQARLYNRLPPFKEMFKQWPDGYGWMNLEPLEPSEDFQDWLSAKDERMKISQKRKRSSSRRK